MSTQQISRIALVSSAAALVLVVALHVLRARDDGQSLAAELAAVAPASAMSERAPGIFLILQPVDCRENLNVVAARNALKLTSDQGREVARGVAGVVISAPRSGAERNDLVIASGMVFPVSFVDREDDTLVRKLRLIGWRQTPLLVGIDAAARIRFVTQATATLDSARLAPLLGLLGG